MEQKTRLTGGFAIGLTAGLGVMTAILIATAISQLATVITYVVFAMLLALGLNPLVKLLEKLKLPKILAITVVVLSFFGSLALLIAMALPVAIEEAAALIEQVPTLVTNFFSLELIAQWDELLGGALTNASGSVVDFVSNSENWPTLLGGVFEVGLGVVSTTFGVILVGILTLYFMASLDELKGYLSRLVSLSKREGFLKITDQISNSVGRWVIGQLSIALIHATVMFTFLSIVQVPFALLLSFIAFLFALVPLVGPVIAFVLITSFSLLSGVETAIAVAIFYLIYLQIDAYLISPRVMKKAVSIPSAAVVIAALAGGTLMGVLGALIAIPLAASALLIVREVWMPKQELR
jgi:predicted PurR-regulated permease PerM